MQVLFLCVCIHSISIDNIDDIGYLAMSVVKYICKGYDFFH